MVHHGKECFQRALIGAGGIWAVRADRENWNVGRTAMLLHLLQGHTEQNKDLLMSLLPER